VLISKELVISRTTLCKALGEIESGIPIEDKFHHRHRKKIEEHLPNLLADIKEICDSQSHTDPKFTSTRLYTRLTVAEIRKQLIEKKGYTDEELPTNRKLTIKINGLGYNLKKVRKTKPLKKIKQTDAIFENVHSVNKQADADPTVLRLSEDTKNKVKTRGGVNPREKRSGRS